MKWRQITFELPILEVSELIELEAAGLRYSTKSWLNLRQYFQNRFVFMEVNEITVRQLL